MQNFIINGQNVHRNVMHLLFSQKCNASCNIHFKIYRVYCVYATMRGLVSYKQNILHNLLFTHKL